MKHAYSIQELKKNAARAFGRDLPISLKDAIEISNYIRGDYVTKAKGKLKAAVNMQRPVPYKRFTNGIGHRKGALTSGRFPVKACQNILVLLESAEANAMYKGLNSKDLTISCIVPKQAPKTYRYGRKSGRKAKRCHVELTVEEAKPVKSKAESANDKASEKETKDKK